MGSVAVLVVMDTCPKAFTLANASPLNPKLFLLRHFSSSKLLSLLVWPRQPSAL